MSFRNILPSLLPYSSPSCKSQLRSSAPNMPKLTRMPLCHSWFRMSMADIGEARDWKYILEHRVSVALGWIVYVRIIEELLDAK